MAGEKHVYDESFEARSDFSSAQYYLVARSSNGVTLNTSPTATGLIGVVQNDPTTEKAATVRLLGLSKVVTDGSGTAIAVGDLLTSSTAGKAIKAVTANHQCIGVANAASTVDGGIIDVLMTGVRRYSST